MTIMAGATIAPSLPQMQEVFGNYEYAAFITRLILTIPAIFIAILAPMAGFIIDNYGRKSTLVISLILYAISGTSGLYLSNLYLILAGRALLGVAVAGIMTCTLTLIGDYFDGKERRSFMGYMGSFMGLGGVLFIWYGGYLADIDWRRPFAIYFFSLLVLIMAIVFIREPQFQRKKSRLLNFKYLRKVPSRIFLIYVTAFLGFLFFYITPIEVPFILNSKTGVNNNTVGISLGISILMGSFISLRYAWFKRQLSYTKIYALTFALMAIGYTFICFAEAFEFFLIGLIFQGLGTGLLMPNSNLWLVNISLAEMRGRLVGNLSFFVYMGQFLAPAFFTPIAKHSSSQSGFGIYAIAMILLAVYFFMIPKKKKTN